MDFIENNVVVNHQVLEKTTKSPKTLHVIESQEYRTRGLFHISDAAYHFFLKLEQQTVLTFQSWQNCKKTWWINTAIVQRIKFS